VTVRNVNKQESRGYRMGARADSAAATGERILDACTEVFWERPTDQVSLDEVARRAGVTRQTVIRRFGSKGGLLAAAAEREAVRVGRSRAEAPTGDVVGAVAVLVAHYEDYGDRVLRMLAEEDSVAGIRELADAGRAVHRDWCARVFAPTLRGLRGAARTRRLAQLVVVCDVMTWKLLRRDCGLSRRETERALVELLSPITEVS